MMTTKELTKEYYDELKAKDAAIYEALNNSKGQNITVTVDSSITTREEAYACMKFLSDEYARFRAFRNERLLKVAESNKFKKELLHAINRVTKQNFIELKCSTHNDTLLLTTETHDYSGELSNFIKDIQAESKAYLNLDPSKVDSLTFITHIWYNLTTGGSNGMQSDIKISASIRENVLYDDCYDITVSL